MTPWRWFIVGVVASLAASCAHAPAQIAQVFSQINEQYHPETHSWSPRWAVFVQGLSADGKRAFDRLYLIHDASGLYFALDKQTWTVVERPGEFWIGRNDLTVPQGTIPLGTWRALLVTLDGQKVEQTFVVATDTSHDPIRPSVRLLPVPATARTYRIEGWVFDTLVWPRDARGSVLATLKVAGAQVTLPDGTATVDLYSYDKTRAEGLIAGPFPIQAVP